MKGVILPALLWPVLGLLAGTARAAEPADRPDPREIPVPPIKTDLGPFPGVNDLPARPGMPDVLTLNDGTRVTTVAQWQRRREEMKQILEYYAVGRIPPPPRNVRGRLVKSQAITDGRVTYRLVHLTFGPGDKLGLDIGIFTPAGPGPWPAVILQGGTPPEATPLPRLPPGPGQGRGLDVLLPVGIIKELVAAADAGRKTGEGGRSQAGIETGVPARPASGNSEAATGANTPTRTARGPFGGPATAESTASRHADVFRRGYALVLFNNNDCAEDTTLRNPDGSWAFRNTRFFPAYPGYDWGILAAWAWGASRIADYLQTDPTIDGGKLIITGASRAGKSAMIAAAFDRRLMGAPVVTGGGGVGAYRFAGPRRSETLDVMQRKYPNWFSPQLHEFWGRRDQLPFDQHWFLALCAPQPFLALEGDADTISLPEAVRQSILAAKPAYALHGAEDRLGVNYAPHGHAFTADDWTALLDFADKHLRGKPVERAFNRFPAEAELDAALMRPATRPR